MASLDDILTTQKNGVVAINLLGTYLKGQYNAIPTASLAQTALGTSYGVIYTATSANSTHIDTINVVNTTGATIQIYLSLVPVDQSPSASNAVFYGNSIPAYTTMLWEGSLILPPSGTVRAYGSASGLTINMTGGTAI